MKRTWLIAVVLATTVATVVGTTSLPAVAAPAAPAPAAAFAPGKPIADCATPPASSTATAANRDRFISLWAPRATNKAWITNYATLTSVPADIAAEGFQAMDGPTQAWLIACLVDSIMNSAGQTATPSQVGQYQLSLDILIFGKDQLQAVRNKLASAEAVPNPTPPSPMQTGGVAAAEVKGLVAQAESAAPLTSAGLPRSNAVAPAVHTAAVAHAAPAGLHPAITPAALDPNALANLLQPILSSPLIALLLAALNSLEQLISHIQAILFTLPVLNLASSLFYHVCAESATQPLACSVSVPFGVPVPVDVTGDNFPDVLCELIPVVANGTDFGVSFSVTRLLTAHLPLAAHVFMVYDVPLANKRVEFGYDGRASTLATNTTTTVTLKNAFHALTGDINVAATVSSISPGATEALTFGVKDLVGGSIGHPPTEANPVAGVVQFNPFPAKLTMGAHLTHNASDEDIFSVGSSTPSTVNAVMDQDVNTISPASHREFTGLIDKLPTSVVVDVKHNGDTQSVTYTASAAIAHVHATDTEFANASDLSSYTKTAIDVLNLPQTMALTMTGAQDISYVAAAPISQITFSTETWLAGMLQQEITGQAQGIPASVHVTDTTAPDISTITYDASSVITSIALSMYDLNNDQTDLSASATAIPTHMQFTQIKSSGLYDLSANAGIGMIKATLTRGGGMYTPDVGVDHATVLKVGNGLGLDFQLSGFQSAHFENLPKTIVTLGLNPGGQPFDAIADLDVPDVHAEVHISNLPSTISVTVDPAASTYTYSASAPITSITALVHKLDTGDLLSAAIVGVPKTITLTLDSANSKITWVASSPTTSVGATAHLTAATLNQPRGLDASLTITGIPVSWSASYGSGGIDFEAPSPGIGSIDAQVTNHGTVHTACPVAGCDQLSGYFDQTAAAPGDADAWLHISNLQRARFTKSAPTATDPGGFVSDLNMGSHGTLYLAATVKVSPTTVGGLETDLIATGEIDNLPSVVHLVSDGGHILYNGDSNPTLILAVQAGDPASIANALLDPPPMVNGISIRDGQVGTGLAIAADINLTGLPDSMDLNTVSGVYTVSNYNPSPDHVLVIDVKLNHIAAKPITASISQDVGAGPVSFVFGPFTTQTVDDGSGGTNKQIAATYTASRAMGALQADVSYGDATTGDQADLYISNIPGGGTAPSVSFTASFGAEQVIDLQMVKPPICATMPTSPSCVYAVSEVKAMYKHTGDPSFTAGAMVDLTHIPHSVHLDLGTGTSSTGSAPQLTFTASDPGLNILASASAAITGKPTDTITHAGGEVMVDVENMGQVVTGGLNGTSLTITSSPATTKFRIIGSGAVTVNVSLDFSDDGFTNTGSLVVQFTLYELTIGFDNATSLGLDLGVTTGLTGDFQTFYLGEDSDLQLTLHEQLDFGVDLPGGLGHVSVTLVGPFDWSPDLGNVIDHWRVYTNTEQTWIPLEFGIPYVVTCGVDIKLRPFWLEDQPVDNLVLNGPPPADSGQTPAYLITPDVLGLPDFVLDIATYFASPYGNALDFVPNCSFGP
jgi:hypothetical protein